MRYPQYQPGARWRVERDNNPFTFVVLGPGRRPGSKRCRVEWDHPNDTSRQNFESDYTHVHLQLHAVYQGGQ